MKKIVWVGAFTPLSSQIRQYLQTPTFLRSNSFIMDQKLENTQAPDIIVSEDFDSLSHYSYRFPNAIQIYLCQEVDLWDSLRFGIRPLHRYYFILKLQTMKDFENLYSKIILLPIDGDRSNGYRNEKKINFYGTLPAMRNSLEVLKKINNDQLIELSHFSQKEEERRRKFQSLIHLARSLSMSRDIEEVVNHLWSDLRSIKGIKEISFLIEHKKHTFQQILYRGGKFHFELISVQTPNQRDFLKSFFQSASNMGLAPLTPREIESISFLYKKPLKNLYSYTLIEDEATKPFLLIIEGIDQWTPNADFEGLLQERLSFIKLTLEKYLLQEEIKTSTNLWTSTFDDLNDPLAIITEKRTFIRANQRFLILSEKEIGTQLISSTDKNSNYSNEPNSENEFSSSTNTHPNPHSTLGMDFLWDNLPKNNNTSYSAEIHLKNKTYYYQVFPIYENMSRLPKANIVHFIDITFERTLYSRLLQSEKMVAIGKLAENLTTALNGPLNIISHSADKALSLNGLTIQTQNDLNDIKKASQRSLKIISDFTHFSEGKIEKIKIEAEAIIEMTIPLIKSLIHGHRFHLNLSKKRHLVYVSLSLLQQVIYNLLRNAHQSMETSGIIEISSKPLTLKDIAGVQIAVLDNGTGVPMELRSKLFQPLVSSKGPDGTGLGLNIVKQIIENHKGLVGYEPLDDGGSKFWIWLPVENK